MYDLMIVGQPSLDFNTDYLGHTLREIGGAVTYSGYAASSLGHSVLALGKCNPNEIDLHEVFAKAGNVTLAVREAGSSTSISNTYHTADKERRTCRVISRIPAYTPGDLPGERAAIYHIAGLMRGDIQESVIEAAAKLGDVALDVQGFLRCARPAGGAMPDGLMEFEDWPRKRELLPLIRFLKTDAAEAEILTGESDRGRAAAMLHAWGSGEIMITHNTEVLLYDGKDYHTRPLRPRGLSGRSGRGDTCFASYITERLARDIPGALLTAAALVSLKMEKPGPFTGGRGDVEEYIRAFYMGEIFS